MAKIGKTTTSFKIFEAPEDSQDNGRKITKEYEIRGITVEQFLSDYGNGKKSSRITRFPRRSKPDETPEATTSTTTPETLKVSPVVPNAPIKPPRMPKKVDMTRKRLQFMEEAESQSADSAVDLNSPSPRYPTRACKNKTSENARPESSKGKQATRLNSRKNKADVDKENDGSLANGRQNEPINRQSSQKSQKNSTKPMMAASQNRLIAEGTRPCSCDSKKPSAADYKPLPCLPRILHTLKRATRLQQGFFFLVP